MFEPVSSRASFPEMEASVLKLWKEREVFRRSWDERPSAPLFMFYEGPPTANGSPGIHHVLARVFKDVINRHRTMKGYRCVRKGGWDTHGLPVELEIEKELKLNSKREIEEYGIERFNQKCRESVFRYVKEWETLTDRIGYWVDMEDPYITLTNDYIESCWWILKTLWDRGLLYQGMRGTPHCPRCETSLSSHEVALGYKDNTPDPSVFVKFRALTWTDGKPPASPTSFLAWTTTPWTLPGNTALAVDEKAEYSLVEIETEAGKEQLVLATALLGKAIRHPYTAIATLQGADLVGLRYQPLYHPAEYGVEVRQFVRRAASDGGAVVNLELTSEFSPRVVAADFVSMEDGTGIVHIAPAFGDEDLNVGRSQGLCFVQPVNLAGRITGAYPFAGKFVKVADNDIMADLKERGILYHRDTYRHTYPFCWRCDTPLLYYAKSSWYIRTTAVKERLVSGNQAINWRPEYIRDGRFGEWLRNNIDWAISRERYWGTPIPLWRCDCGEMACVGSVAELKSRAIAEDRGKVDTLDLHRPYVDDIRLACAKCGGTMRRIPEVLDAWFDSGAMPYAQWHVISDSDFQRIQGEGRFPADYICEGLDQTRGWFYSLHALGTLLAGQPAYRNVICLGLILDGRGRKMSKRLGNVVQPIPVLDALGADAVRWYLFTASHPGEPRRFSDKLVNETLRRTLLTLWNVYSFFVTYANVDRFNPGQIPAGWKPTEELDRWILAELNSLAAQVDHDLEHYDPTNAGRRIGDFIDVLSNWYVRRSRRRFWKGENDAEKLSGYVTLYTCLVTVAKLMAPLAPFIAEAIYQNLVRSADASAPDSVHLAQYPQADASLIDQPLLEATRLAQRVASMGRAARAKAGLKVRQPLALALVRPRSAAEVAYLRQVEPQILDELNIKALQVAESDGELWQAAQQAAGEKGEGVFQVGNYWASLEAGYLVAVDSVVTPELAAEGLARELAHRIQNLRKDAGFELTDRIITYYQGPEDVRRVMGQFADYIQQETLTQRLVAGAPENGAKSETQNVEGMEVTLAVQRA